MDAAGGGRGGGFQCVSVPPPSFNSPNGVCHNPAGGVLGSDQRIQYAAFEGIKEKDSCWLANKVQNLHWLQVKKNRAELL